MNRWRWMIALMLAPLLMAAWPDIYPSRRVAINSFRYDLISPDIAFDADLVAQHYERACKMGFPAACRWQEWQGEDGRTDLALAGEVLGQRCSGEPLACVVQGWAESRVDGVLSEAAPNPRAAFNRFQRTCTKDQYAPACTSLGELYLAGVGTTASTDKGIALLTEGCKAKDWWGCYQLGRLSDEGVGGTRDAAAAAAYYKTACDEDVVQACAALGQLMLVGDGIERSRTGAAELFGRTCGERHAASCSTLAWLYERGEGVIRSAPVALGLYRTACTAGDTSACHRMAIIYLEGRGVEADPDATVGLLEGACGAGYAPSCSVMGTILLDGELMAEDLTAGLRYLTQGCEGGDTLGCVNMGRLYEQGRGVTQDLPRAVQIFREACAQQSGEGCAALAALHEQGRGVEKDPEAALAMLHRACDVGHGESCSHLAVKYRDGDGVEASPAEVIRLLSMGCDGEHGPSCGRLAEIYKKGESGQAVDQARAIELYQRACALRDPIGCYFIARAYQTGEGLPEKATLALDNYQFACDAGVTEGCEAIPSVEFRARFEGVIDEAMPPGTCQVWGHDEVNSERDRQLAEFSGSTLRMLIGEYENRDLTVSHLRNEYVEGKSPEGRSFWGVTLVWEALNLEFEHHEVWKKSRGPFPAAQSFSRVTPEGLTGTGSGKPDLIFDRQSETVVLPRNSRCRFVEDYSALTTEHCSPVQSLIAANLLSDCP
jgi:TPR repeat protein